MVNDVEDAPVTDRNAEEIATQHQHLWRMRVLLEHVELFVDAPSVSASKAAQLSPGVGIELKPKWVGRVRCHELDVSAAQSETISS